MQSITSASRLVAGRRISLLRTSPALLRNYGSPVTGPLRGKDVDDPQMNGYPQLPFVSKQYRSAKGWDDPQMRRNFEEPLHYKEEIVSMWGPDTPVVHPRQALNQFTIVALGFVTFGLLCNYVLQPARPSVAREYPFSGLVTELGGVEQNKARVESEEEPEE